MTPEVLATFLAGVVAVPILQVFKRNMKLSGVPMAFAAYVLSWVIAAFVLVVFAGLSWRELFESPDKLALHGSTVAAVATLTYRAIAEKMKLGGSMPRKKRTRKKS